MSDNTLTLYSVSATWHGNILEEILDFILMSESYIRAICKLCRDEAVKKCGSSTTDLNTPHLVRPCGETHCFTIVPQKLARQPDTSGLTCIISEC